MSVFKLSRFAVWILALVSILNAGCNEEEQVKPTTSTQNSYAKDDSPGNSRVLIYDVRSELRKQRVK